ncbi:MAG TPA: hypothetical protein VGP70_14100 [Actinomadura sp.]|nr:hypothetical protein [Actinomadura sp.]
MSLSWEQVEGASTGNGRVWIHQKGLSKPVLSIPLQNPNAVLIPPALRSLQAVNGPAREHPRRPDPDGSITPRGR